MNDELASLFNNFDRGTITRRQLLQAGGLGLFGLSKGLPFTFYLLLVNVPYGIVTAILARWLSPSAATRPGNQT